MATLYTVTVTAPDGTEVLNESVDIELLGTNQEEARAGYLSGLPEDEWHGRVAAALVGTEVCPWDCSYCRD